jgi:thioredoxin 2
LRSHEPLPESRFAEGPTCGVVISAVAANPAIIESHDFDAIVLRRPAGMVDFWPLVDPAPPWRRISPRLQRGQPRVRLAKDMEAQRARGTLRDPHIPTLILFDRGSELARQTGGMGARQIIDWTGHQLQNRR